MRAGHQLSILTLLLCACSSCTMLHRVRTLNERYSTTLAIEGIQAKALTEYTHPDSLRILYPVSRSQQASIERHLSTAIECGDTSQVLQLSRLLGRGDLVLHYAPKRDLQARAEGCLLVGNYGEAHRLATQDSAPSTATLAMCHLMIGDTAAALPLLRSVADSGPRDTRLPALRILCHLCPEDTGLRKQLYRATPLDEERDYLDILYLVGDTKASTEEVQKLAKKLLDEHRASPLWTASAVSICPLLVEHGLFVQLYDIVDLLDSSAATNYPYTLIQEYQDEVKLLRAYETKAYVTAPQESQRTFRQKYGQITRGPNWAMTYSKGDSAQTLPPPTTEIYLNIKEKLKAVLLKQTPPKQPNRQLMHF